MNRPRPLRVGVAGLGFGAAVHIPAFLGMPDTRLVAIMGQRPDRTRAAAEKIGAAACNSAEELFAYSLDAVSIALPPAETAALTEKALHRGIAVLAEKPLAPTAAWAFELAQIAQLRKLANAVDFEFAELACFRSMAELLEQGRLGRLIEVNIVWRGLSYAQERQTWSWKSDAGRHGGVLTLLGTHLLHMAERLFGPLNVVAASLSAVATAKFTPPGEMPAEDTASLQLEGADVLPITVLLSNSDSRPPLHKWIVRGTAGEMTMENSGADPVRGFTLRIRSREFEEVITQETANVEGTDSRLVPFGRLAGQFLLSVRGGAAAVPDFLSAARTQQLIDDVRRHPLGTMQ